MNTSNALVGGLMIGSAVAIPGLAVGVRARRSLGRTVGQITAEHHLAAAHRADLLADVERLRRQLSTIGAERDRLDLAAHDLHDSLARAVESRAEQQRRADHAEARLAASHEALTRLQHDLQATRDELLKAIARNDNLSNELTAARTRRPGWNDPDAPERYR